MRTKTKKILYKITKIIWFVIGGFVLFWTGVFFIKMHTIHTLGVIGAALLFAAGLYILAIYIMITFLFILIKWIIKKYKKKINKIQKD